MWKNGRFVQPCKASRILSGITALHTIHATHDVNERTLNINHWARVSKVSRVPSKLIQGIRIGYTKILPDIISGLRTERNGTVYKMAVRNAC